MQYVHVNISLQYAIWVPGLTILLKGPLIITPIDNYLTKIRGGWTRGPGKSSDSTIVNGEDFNLLRTLPNKINKTYKTVSPSAS